MTRWRLPVLLPLVLGVGLVVVAVLGPTDRNKYLLTAIGVLLSLIALWKQLVAPPSEPGLDELTDLLALAMQNQWTQAANDRRLLHPAPLPIRWRRTTEPIAGPAAAATLTRADHALFDPLPGLDRVTASRLRRGTRRDLHRIYGGLASGRLLLVGGPGAGKSSAAVLLLLDALRFRNQGNAIDRPRIPVPVLFTLHDWDPAIISVQDWLCTKLTEIPLFRGRCGADRATRLLQAGRIAVFLDGLDEMPPHTRNVALQALSEQAAFRLVLLTRTTELATAAQQHTLTGAAALELQPLMPSDVADYLLRPLTEPAPRAWQRLATTLTTQPDSHLAHALTTPLAVGLLRDVYPPSAPVDELCDVTCFPHSDTITNHLLDHAIVAAYSPRPGQPPPRYTIETAQRALGLIAAQLAHRKARDLAWWTIPNWIPRIPRTLIITLTTVPFLLAFGFAGGLGFFFAFEFAGRFAIGLTVGCAVGLMNLLGISSTPVQMRLNAWRPRFTSLSSSVVGIVVGIAGALTGSLALSVGLGLPGGLTGGFMGALVFWLMVLLFDETHSTTEPVSPVTTWRNDLAARFAVALGLALMLGLAAGLAIGLAGEDSVGFSVGLGVGLGAGLAAGLAVGLAFWFLWFLPSPVLRVGLTQIYLTTRHDTPRRLIRFLEDARARHILRTVGPVYQFRHATLQDRLAPHQSPVGNLPTPTANTR